MTQRTDERVWHHNSSLACMCDDISPSLERDLLPSQKNQHLYTYNGTNKCDVIVLEWYN